MDLYRLCSTSYTPHLDLTRHLSLHQRCLENELPLVAPPFSVGFLGYQAISSIARRRSISRVVWKMATEDVGTCNPIVYLTRIERFSAAHRLNRSVWWELTRYSPLQDY